MHLFVRHIAAKRTSWLLALLITYGLEDTLAAVCTFIAFSDY